jgi:hypothetical protein
MFVTNYVPESSIGSVVGRGYFYRLTGGSRTLTRKAVLLK